MGVDWDEEASTRGDLERLSGGSDFSGYADSVFSGDSGYTGLSGVSGAFHNRALLPPRVRGNPLLDPTAPDYDPSEHLKRLTENDAADDADRFSLARGLSMGLGSLALDDGYGAISTFEGTSRSDESARGRRRGATRTGDDTATSPPPRAPRRRGTRAR